MARRYVALLRGINVGRAKRVAMADLRALLEGLGYGEVRTLLNSGNAVFTADGRAAAMGKAIERGLVARLGVASRVIVLTARELDRVVAENPHGRIAKDPTRHLVAFVVTAADARRLAPLLREDWAPEALALGPRVAYLWCPRGFLDSPLPEAVGRVLGDAMTVRNWATVTKLQALAAS